MPDPETIEEAIEQNMLGPKRVQIASQSVEMPSVDEQIKAAQYLAAQNAGSVAHFGLRFSRLIAGPRE